MRKIVLAATAAMLALGGVAVMSETAGAAKPTITATGSVNCNIEGKVKINPPLRNSNTTPSTVTGKIKGLCTGTTEQGVTPAKLKAALTYTGSGPGTCNGLAQPSSDPFNVNMKWKGTGGKINESNAVFKGFVLTGTPSFGFRLPNPASTPPQSTVSGSYAGTNNAEAFASIDIPDTSLCEPTTKPNGKVKPAKGIKKIVVKPGSTLSIS
jgi:hypothetical protein